MLILRPASWLALLSRTFTFELSLTGSPQANVEYDYVGKQSISYDPTFTGKSNGIMGCRTRSDPKSPDPKSPQADPGRDSSQSPGENGQDFVEILGTGAIAP